MNTKSAHNENRLRIKGIQKRQVNAGRWAMKRGLEIAVTISYNRMCQTKKRVCAYLTHTLFTLLYMYLLETTKIFYRLLHIGCKGAMGQQEPFPTSC